MPALERKLLLLSLLISALAAALTYALAIYKVEQAVRQATLGRIALVIEQIERAAEHNLMLGIAIDDMKALAPLLKRQQASEAALLSVDVTRPGGQVLHSTDPIRVGQIAPSSARCTAAQRTRLGVQTYQGVLRVSKAITNSFDAVQACVTTDVNAESLQVTVARARTRLMLACGLAFLLGSAALFFGFRRLVGRFALKVDQPQRWGLGPAPQAEPA
jgi:hypothetical protein